MSSGAFTLSDIDKPIAAPQQKGQFSAADVEPKKYLPGRQFGMDIARGMGLDADKIKAAEDSGGQGAALKELGGQVLEGLKGVIKDPLLPVTAPAGNFENAIKSGSPGQIVGALASILGGAEGAEKGVKVTAGARESIGGAIHTPEGDLTPGAKSAAKIGGGAVGGMVGATAGHEYLGAAAGYKLGPSLLESIFPEPKDAAEARAQAELFQSKAEDLMRRGKEQDALDRKAAKEAKENVVQSNPFEAPPANPKGTILSPDSPAPPINKTYVSYPANLLVQLAKSGDLHAFRELIRNPRGVDVTQIPGYKFLMDADVRPGRVYGGPTE
jgi:hypothetical protein